MGTFRGYRLTALVLVSGLIPQIAVPQIGAPRVVVPPLAVPVKKAAKRILAYHKPEKFEPHRDIAAIASYITPSWVRKAPASYADENEGYLTDLQINTPSQSLFDRGDIMTRQQELQLEQAFNDLNRDFDRRNTYGLTDPDSTRIQYDRMRDFSRQMFGAVRTHQSDVYRGKIDRAATGLAKNDVGTPGQAAGCGVTTIGPHNEIRETVAVHVSGACHALAAAVTVALPIDHEAAGACRNGGKRHDAAIASPENNVAAPDGVLHTAGVA